MALKDTRTIIKTTVIAVLLVLIITYTYLQTRDFLTGPQLTITSPENGQSVSSSSPEIILSGETSHISFLTVNGLQVFTDENGTFSRKLLLPEGYTIITVEAQDKFGRSITREIQLIVK